MKRMCLLILMTFSLLSLSGCFGLSIHIRKQAFKPHELFKKAYRKIEKIHRLDPLRKNRVRRFCVLVYEGDDRELVQVKVPMWLMNLVWSHTSHHKEIRSEHQSMDKYCSFDEEAWKNLVQFGPGLLLEVNDRTDGTQVLLWQE